MTIWYGAVSIGTFTVRVGEAGAIETNEDPDAYDNVWVARDSGVGVDLYGVAYNGTYLVAVGAGGVGVRSVDGITWETVTTGVAVNLNDIASASNVFLAVGDAGTLLSSQDSAVWEAIPSGTVENLWGVTIDSAVYYAVGDNDTVITGVITSEEMNVHLLEAVDLTSGQSDNAIQNLAAEDGLFADEANSRNLQFDNVYDGYLIDYAQFGNDITHELNGLDPQSGTAEAIADLTPVIEESTAFIENNIQGLTGPNTGEPQFAYASDEANLFTDQFTEGRHNHSGVDSFTVAQRLFDSYEKLTDAMTLTSQAPLAYLHFLLTEGMGISGVGEALQLFIHDLEEAVGVSETLEGTGSFAMVVPETLGVDDALSPNQVLSLLVEEEVFASTSFVYDGETYTGVVVNTENMARSEYLGFNFNSMCSFNGRYYGAKSDGIYLLEGDNDDGAGIDAAIKLGITDFGSRQNKRVQDAYLGLRNDGNMVLKVNTRAPDGTLQQHLYELSDNSEALDQTRVKIGKGLKAVYWQFELVNKDGADFELDHLTFYPLALTRRV